MSGSQGQTLHDLRQEIRRLRSGIETASASYAHQLELARGLRDEAAARLKDALAERDAATLRAEVAECRVLGLEKRVRELTEALNQSRATSTRRNG